MRIYTHTENKIKDSNYKQARNKTLSLNTQLYVNEGREKERERKTTESNCNPDRIGSTYNSLLPQVLY